MSYKPIDTDAKVGGWGLPGGEVQLRDTMTRRGFVRGSAMAVVGASVVPSFLARSLCAERARATVDRKKLVVIFMRGACDGLNIVVPYAEKNYYALRPTIAIQREDVIDLDGAFGLHPAMASLKPLYDQGHLAIVQAVGSPDSSKSHLDAQDFMESGTPGIKGMRDGWLNRALRAEVERGKSSTVRAAAFGYEVPKTLRGDAASVAVYDESSGEMLDGAELAKFDGVERLRVGDSALCRPVAGAMYPKTPFGNRMKRVAQWMKADSEVDVAFADCGGWDTHQHQGGVQGRLADRLTEFSETVAAFWKDLGDEAENVMLVTMSEFGRALRQNGTGGTDHGRANVMFVLGGSVKGGSIYGTWPGIEDEERDLPVTTDFRTVLGEIAYKALGARDLEAVFPGARVTPGDFLNFA